MAAVLVVHAHRERVAAALSVMVVDQHHRHAETLQVLQVERPNARGCDDEAIHPFGAEHFHGGQFPFWFGGGTGQDDGVVVFLGRVLNALHHFSDEWIGDGGHDDAHGAGFLRHQAASDGVRSVAHLLGQTLDAGFGLGFYEGTIAQGAGDGRMGNAGRFGDVLDRDAHRGGSCLHTYAQSIQKKAISR